MKRLRVGIDARLSGKAHAGIGRYIEELVKGLLKLPTDHTFVVFVSKKDQLPWLISSDRVEVVVLPIRHYTIKEQIVVPFVFYKKHLDLLHVPHFNVPIFYKKPMVITIHDLLWHEKKEKDATTLSPFMHALKYRAYKFVSEHGMRVSKKIIVPTESVKKDVEKFVDSKKIVVLSEGVNDVYFEKQKVEKRMYDFPYLIYTGSLYPHKNVSVVLDALKKFPMLHFVVCGSRSVFLDAFKKQIEEKHMNARVHLLGYVEDKKLSQLYAQAVALVQPSFSEGFGLTGVEAMASGCPVIASDIPVLHEVYKDAALFFDPYNIASLVQKVKECMSTPLYRKTLEKHGKEVSSMYRWQNVSKNTLSVYESLL